MNELLAYLPATSSEWMILSLGIALLVILVLAVLLLRRRRGSATIPVQSAAKNDIPSLLTQSELACFNTLKAVAGNEFYIMAKVSLSDIAVVKKGVDQARLKRAAKQGKRHIDFILCNKESLAVICAIELEDAATAASRKRESHSADLLEEVGVVVFHMPVKTSYSIPEMQQALTPYLKGHQPSPDEMVATVSMEAFRSCKTCKARMVLKRAKSGKYKGVLFWVCSNYPKCKTFELFVR
ncbi:MAG: DUF2726 domain-containing protein [Mariprofundaceae bacterium]|nr:DUF2726 domain-containing protein [Mariprofundaceae bacterium]